MAFRIDSRILALAMARMVDALANSFLVVVLPLYIGSQIVSLPPFVGSWSDRLGRRKPFLLFGLALVAVGSAGYIFFTDYLSILVMRALQGVGAAFTVPVTVALVNGRRGSRARRCRF